MEVWRLPAWFSIEWWGAEGAGGGADEADGAEGEAVAGHGAAATGSATDSLGSSPLVPASGETNSIHTRFSVCGATETREQQDTVELQHFLHCCCISAVISALPVTDVSLKSPSLVFQCIHLNS